MFMLALVKGGAPDYPAEDRAGGMIRLYPETANCPCHLRSAGLKMLENDRLRFFAS
jgi:hypothetical protein